MRAYLKRVCPFHHSLHLWLGLAMLLFAAASVVAQESVPQPWDGRDVGAVGRPGSASFSDGNHTVTVSGSGADIWGVADAFQFVSTRNTFGTTGDFTARVTTEQFTNQYAKAGIMRRKSYDASSAHVILDVKPDGGVEFMTRAHDGGTTTFIAGTMSVFPVWLKLSSSTTTITAQISTDGKTWTTLGSTPFANTDIAFNGLAVTSHDNSVLNQSSFDNISIAPIYPDDVLPYPWRQVNVGSTGPSGGASYSSGTLSVTGSGSDIWGSADSFHFVYYETGSISEDSQITARLTGLQNTNAYAKAGLMFRQSLEANAGAIVLDIKPDGGVEFMARRSAGDTMSFIGGASQPAPGWLRLVRRSGVVSGYVSADDQTWLKVGEVSISWPPDVAYAGLAVTSHDNSRTNTATFDNVTPYFSQDIGDVGVEGSVAHGELTNTVAGAGGDIWGTADAFHYMSLPFHSASAHSMTVHVRSMENTNPFAKAGIMVRESMAPDSPYVLLDVKPDGGIEFMTRQAAGGSTTFIAGASLSWSQPVWLQLDMNDQTVTAYAFSDATSRSSWTLVGTTTISLSPNASIGIAVTSHDRSRTNTVVFDDPNIDP